MLARLCRRVKAGLMCTHHAAVGGTHNHHDSDDVDPIDQMLGGPVDPAWRDFPVEYITLDIPTGATEQDRETALCDCMEREGRRLLDELE